MGLPPPFETTFRRRSRARREIASFNDGALRAAASWKRSSSRSLSSNRSSGASAMAGFAETYVDQNERGYAALKAAVEAGMVEARTGV
jgi:hypothetical protein